VKEYAIECRFMGKVATGTGLSKQDARAAAGLKILEEIEKEKAENAKKTLTKASKKAPKKAQNKAAEVRAEQKSADKNATKKAHQPKQKRKVFTKKA
jgi:ribosomal protein S12 methylthiotransferase accessory factor YcaO